jgi:serine/threonine-protein kinase HipA
MNEERYGVWLYGELVGFIDQAGDYTVFAFTPEYVGDPDRSILGLAFEERLDVPVASHLRLPPWFSNLLPEGRLREWIALDRGVSADREMELLAQVGHDLPGAVQVVKADSIPDTFDEGLLADQTSKDESRDGRAPGWHFSLAGVGLKFSMLQRGDRLTLPAFGEGGDWIVKLPDSLFSDVPINENAMMSLAGSAGIRVPEHKLVHRGELDTLPPNVWRSDEEYAYAVRRFDRGEDRNLIHIEDFAQVRNVYPYGDGKYRGNFETVASLAYRRRDFEALQQVVRRLAFNALISNGDAHLKNWSLIYYDRRRPTLSPAYDLVSTEMYRQAGDPENFGLKFGGTRRLDQISLMSFEWLESRLNANKANLAECAQDTVDRAIAGWPVIAASLDESPWVRDQIGASIKRRRETLLRPVKR